MLLLLRSSRPIVVQHKFLCSFFFSTCTNLTHSNNEYQKALSLIDQLPIFAPIRINNETNIKKNPLKSNQKHNYLSNKLPKVYKIFGNDKEFPNLISHHLPPDKPSPFYDGLKSIEPPQKEQRLSVTSLLTKSWCEIRSAYDIYSQIPRFTTTQLLSGTKQHSNLELISHPIDMDLIEFNTKWEVPKDRIIDQWVQTILRLITLFKTGEAREIPCFALVDTMNDKFPLLENVSVEEWEAIFQQTNTSDANNKMRPQYILLSGIIDHLTLKGVNSQEEAPLSIISHWKSPHNDIQTLLSNINDSIETKEWEIQVADTKTRQTFKIPSQTSVLNASRTQVMYYMKFLSIMGQDPDITYKNLLLNMTGRGYNVNQPLDPLKIFSLMLETPFLISDLEKLKDGKPIGFSQFDKGAKPNHRVSNNLSSYYDQFNTPETKHLLQFWTTWDTPVTLRYLAVRLSQLYHCIGKILSSRMVIEYYCRGANFHNEYFQFNEKQFDESRIDSLNFWFGKRDIQPFEPTIYNFTTFCKNCDYRDVCSWKKKGEELCKGMGTTLSSFTKIK